MDWKTHALALGDQLAHLLDNGAAEATVDCETTRPWPELCADAQAVLDAFDRACEQAGVYVCDLDLTETEDAG